MSENYLSLKFFISIITID